MLKLKLKSTLLVAIMVMLTFQPLVVEAQGLVKCGIRGSGYVDGKPVNPCTFKDLFELVYLVVNTLIGLAGLVALFFVVWGGAQMLLSRGAPDRVQAAKQTIWNAIFGLVLTLMAYLIVSFVVGLTMPGTGGDPLKSIINFINP